VSKQALFKQALEAQIAAQDATAVLLNALLDPIGYPYLHGWEIYAVYSGSTFSDETHLTLVPPEMTSEAWTPRLLNEIKDKLGANWIAPYAHYDGSRTRVALHVRWLRPEKKEAVDSPSTAPSD